MTTAESSRRQKHLAEIQGETCISFNSRWTFHLMRCFFFIGFLLVMHYSPNVRLILCDCKNHGDTYLVSGRVQKYFIRILDKEGSSFNSTLHIFLLLKFSHFFLYLKLVNRDYLNFIQIVALMKIQQLTTTSISCGIESKFLHIAKVSWSCCSTLLICTVSKIV